MEIGLQTFTVRKLIRTPKALDETFGKLAALGLHNLELAVDYLAFPFTPDTARMIGAVAKRCGLRIASCQIKYATAAKDVPATIVFMQELGAEILVNSVIDMKLLNKGVGGLLRHCEMLEALREKLAPGGISLAHHNHHYEFLRVADLSLTTFGRGHRTSDYINVKARRSTDVVSVLDFMAANSSVDFTLDTYWCQRGGGNVIALLEELKGRAPVMHLRDFTLTKRGLVTGGADCACGQGNIPFGAVLRAAEAAGVRYGMIEQNTKTPLESVGVSAKYLLGL